MTSYNLPLEWFKGLDEREKERLKRELPASISLLERLLQIQNERYDKYQKDFLSLDKSPEMLYNLGYSVGKMAEIEDFTAFIKRTIDVINKQ